MKEIAGVFRFGGIIGVEEATYTRSRGIQPGVCQVRIPAEGNPIPIGTTDTMAWGDGENFHYFPGCLVSDVYTDMSRGGSWIITILDRRWMWEKFGQVSGNFNVRKAGSIINATRKNPRKLAEYCLEALGETDYDLSGLPTDIYPEVNWDMDLPGPALESLCRELGCVVCLQLDNTVRICKIGDGAELPKIRGCNIKPGIVIAKMPDEIGFAAAPTTWQVDMELHDPQGYETWPDSQWGFLQSIYKLSYTPKHGWEKEDPISFPSIQADLPADKPRLLRAAAQRSVWKWWKVKFPIELPAATSALGPDGLKKTPKITSPLELLPILDYQLEKEAIGLLHSSVANTETAITYTRKPAMLFGRFHDHSDMSKDNVPTVKPYADIAANPKLIYRGGFTIDNDACMVRLSDPAFRYLKKIQPQLFPTKILTESVGFMEPDLYLRAAVNYRDKDTGAAWRWTATMKTGATNGTPTEWIYRSDIRHEIYRDAKTGKIVDNEEEVKAAAMYYLKAAMQKYKPKNPKEADYSTLPPINLDGAIAQVAFSIDREGYVRSQASRDMEFSVVTPSYEDRQKAMAYQSMLQSNQQIRNAVAGNPKGNK